uniref:Anaphase-promoting complex subunit 2 n=1 Tax=Rhabditophanes sp. KR3021 TaxID=114890 RepID=A0AC35TL01_9BILA
MEEPMDISDDFVDFRPQDFCTTELFNFYIHLFGVHENISTKEAVAIIKCANSELLSEKVANYLHSIGGEDALSLVERMLVLIDAMCYVVDVCAAKVPKVSNAKEKLMKMMGTTLQSYPCSGILNSIVEKILTLSFYARNVTKKTYSGPEQKKFLSIYNLTLKFFHGFGNRNTFGMGYLIGKVIMQNVDSFILMSNEEKKISLVKPNLIGQLKRKTGPVFRWLNDLKLENSIEIEDAYKLRCEMYVLNNIADSMFDAIVLYPKTGATFRTLGRFMSQFGLSAREKVSNIITEEIKANLLHIGIATDDILRVYASCVESMKILDNTCVMMHKICKIIKDYIKGRQDTVRSIVSYLMTDHQTGWKNKLSANTGLIVDEEDISVLNDEFLPSVEEATIKQWRDWNPDPPDAPPGDSRFFRQSADLFNMLVSIYGSKDLFVKEYRQLLSERLIQAENGAIESEIKYLNILKRRFTDGELQNCEVMLKDMRDSKEIDDQVYCSSKLKYIVECRILSYHFWPKIEFEEFKVPEPLAYSCDIYKMQYEKVRRQRTLKFYPSYGHVVFDVTLRGITCEITATIYQASVILFFCRHHEYTTDDLATSLEMDRITMKKACEFWVTLGFLTPTEFDEGDGFAISESKVNMERVQKHLDNQDVESDDEEGGTYDTKIIDSLEQYWNYTKNMIKTNPEGLKPERLLQIYKMFTSPSKRGPTIDHVNMLLQRKVKQNLLSVENGMYYIVEKGEEDE